MVKNGIRGSIRVFKTDIFYEPDTVERVIVNDGTSTASIIPSCLTKELQTIFDRHGIDYPSTRKDGQRFVKSIEGLKFDSIEHADKDHLRLKFVAESKREMRELLERAIFWIKKHKILYGESNGKKFCLFRCYDDDQLEQLELDETI